jgi:hypothetical protein
MDDYREVNRANWDERAAAHAASPDYSVSRFTDDPAFLSEVVTFDLPRLGDIKGLDAVHLQCHIGTDTVSLARLGARMTGLDFSAPALEEGRRLAASTSSSPGSARSAGCLTSSAGPRSWPPCCDRAAASSSARDTRSCGR